MRILFGLALWTLALAPGEAGAEIGIQAVRSRGRVVFTNQMAPFALPALPASGISGGPAVSSPLETLVRTIATNHGVDPDLVAAMIRTESNFNRWAVSRKGALGLMQLIPETGRRFGVRDFFDASQNIDGGVRYLKSLLEMFKGDLDLSLAAYNAGENLVQRVRRVPAIAETRKYVQKVRDLYGKKDPAVVSGSLPGAASTAPAAELPQRIFRRVDSRGIAHYSNVEPPQH